LLILLVRPAGVPGIDPGGVDPVPIPDPAPIPVPARTPVGAC
jgi:hypothetical protein